VLTDEKYANTLRENAYRRIQDRYDWDKIAQQTERIYEGVLGEYSKSFWA
jgi:glycosyltransferase involved in cell wall biosynthesis